MKPEFSQKAMGLCFVVGLTLVVVTAIVTSFVSGDRGFAPGSINEVIDDSYGPITDEAVPLPPAPAEAEPAPVPPLPAAAPDEDVDETLRDEAVEPPSA